MECDLIETDLKDFRDFISGQLERGGRVPTPEECLRLWREWRETNDAIRQGIADADGRLGQPLDEFLAEFRHRNGLPVRD